MTLSVLYGSVFAAPAQAHVVTVNCVGIMGKGNALECKQRYPKIFLDYVRRCKGGKINPGRISVEDCYPLDNGSYIILMPTKMTWRASSKLEWIETGAADLLGHCYRLNLDTVAMPPPGCGNGGLKLHEEVRPILDAMFEEEKLQVTLCI